MNRVTEAERMLIGGELVESLGGKWAVSVNPAGMFDGAIWADVAALAILVVLFVIQRRVPGW